MNGLRVLLYKEWRDQRVLLSGALVLSALLIAAAKLLGGPRFDPELREHFVLPACLAVIAIVLAAESFVRDSHTGMERTLLRLPLTRSLVWFAKVGFVALASLGSLVFLSMLEDGLRFLEHRPLAASSLVSIPTTLLLLAAVMACAALAAACVIRHSLLAALLGLAALAGVPLLAWLLLPSRFSGWIDVVLNSWYPAELLLFITLGLLLGSWLAFRVRRPHALVLRRAGAAALGSSALLLPAIAGTAWKHSWALDIVPFSASARIFQVAASPDGRFLAVQAEQTWTPRCDWFPVSRKPPGNHDRVRREVWILDRSTGAWNEIDGRFRMLAGWAAWDERSRLETISMPDEFGESEYLLEHIDPTTSTIEVSHPESFSRALGSWCTRFSEKSTHVLRWTERGIEVRVPKDDLLVPSTEPGIAFLEEDGFLVRRDLASGGTTRLVPLAGPSGFRFLRVSSNGARLDVNTSLGESQLIDACDGRELHRFTPGSGWCGWSSVPGRICLVWGAGDAFSVLNEDGSLTPLPGFAGGCQELGSDRILRHDEQHIECMKLDGSDRQLLYEARP